MRADGRQTAGTCARWHVLPAQHVVYLPAQVVAVSSNSIETHPQVGPLPHVGTPPLTAALSSACATKRPTPLLHPPHCFHLQDGPENMAADAKEYGYTFPFLYDESQDVAKAYCAACTPEFYVFDANMCLT